MKTHMAKLLSSIVLSSGLFAGIWASAAGAAPIPWTRTADPDNVSTDPKLVLTLRIKEIKPGDTWKATFTNNGTEIANGDGSIFGYQVSNTGTAKEASEKVGVRSTGNGRGIKQVNGKEITDVRYYKNGAKITEQKVAIFDPLPMHVNGTASATTSMLPLLGALEANGFTDDESPLQVPGWSNSSGASQLYVGTVLNRYIPTRIPLTPEMDGSIYDVSNGQLSARVSGTGPAVSELSGFYFSTTPLITLTDEFTGTGFSGQVMIDGNLELSAVPEPGMLRFALSGALPLLRRQRRPTATHP